MANHSQRLDGCALAFVRRRGYELDVRNQHLAVTEPSDQGAAANRRPALPSVGSGSLSAAVAAAAAFPAAVAEPRRYVSGRERSMVTDDPDIPLFANLQDTDPDVVTAVSEAKKTLPQFLDAAASRRLSPATFLVIVPFLDRSGTAERALVLTLDTAAENLGRPICHLWLSVTSVLDDLVFCLVGEAPDKLRLRPGTAFVVASESIEDWMINNGGEAYGGFSLRVIRSRLGTEGQMRFDARTGIRRFKELMP